METKFDTFRNAKLADEILYLDNDQGYEKCDEPMELVQVTGVLSDEEAGKLHENIIVHAGSSFVDNQIKRGDTIYLTALFKKPGTSYSVQQQGVIQCRIVDVFQGLSKLNSLMKK